MELTNKTYELIIDMTGAIIASTGYQSVGVLFYSSLLNRGLFAFWGQLPCPTHVLPMSS